ncbi:thioredoxin [bacterium]|nr:thioredoxin [Methanomicrobia archaeon]MCD6148871.1 thioredoxin [bacterium]HDM22771.1 thioredoxin [Methanomicrobia archaeon]
MDELERIKKEKLEKMMERVKNPPIKKPVEVTDDNFNDFLRKKKYAIVDCWASWCMPCRIIAPSIEKLAEEYGDRVAVGKLNVDENRRTAAMFGIMSIPTVLFFRDGRLVDKIIGAVPKHILEGKLKQVME